MSDYQTWLKSQETHPVVLHELHHSGGVEYVSTAPYWTHPDDAAPNQTYYSRVMTDLFIESWIDRGLAFGDIELANTGNIDHWLDYVWSGYPVYSFIGDASWPRQEFYPVGAAIIDNHSQPANNRFRLSLRELATRLDRDALLSATLNDHLLPRVYGDVRGIAPIKIDDDQNIYAVSDGAVQSITVYVDEQPVNASNIDLASGQFRLNNNSGSVTADVVAGNSDLMTLAGQLVHGAGMQLAPAARLNSWQLSVPLGVYVRNESDTALSVLRSLCESVGVSIGNTPAGYIRLTAKSLSADIPALSLDSGDLFTCNHKEVLPPVRELQLTGSSWTLRQVNAVDHLGNFTDVSLSSALTSDTDAAVEAARLLGERDRQRNVWDIRAGADALPVELGDLIALSHDRYGLSGVTGKCLGYRKYIGRRNQVTLEMLV